MGEFIYYTYKVEVVLSAGSGLVALDAAVVVVILNLARRSVEGIKYVL